jgi:hypothetical protein
MKLSLRALSLVSCAAVLMAAAGTANADTVSGTAYYDIASPSGPTSQGSQYAVNGVTLSTLSAAEGTSSGSTTFTSNSINYDAGYGNSITSLAGFLTSTAGNTTFTGATPTGAATGTLLVLTGSVYLNDGQYYTLTHDDGVNLYIGAGSSAPTTLLVGAGGQTTANQAPFEFTGTSGNYNFELLYVSNYAPPSELISNLGQTPEPSSFILLGSGLLAAAGVVRRRLTA